MYNYDTERCECLILNSINTSGFWFDHFKKIQDN